MSSRITPSNYSRYKSSNDKNQKKFCGVCHKSGLSEKEYTSHFTKSTPGPTGTVICPTILNNECSFCFQFGHFKSGCPSLAERNRSDKKRVFEEKCEQKKQVPVAIPVAAPLNRGGFAILDSDSDNESTPVVKEEWPSLSTAKTIRSVSDKPSFATVISAPLPIKKAANSQPSLCGFSILKRSASVAPKTPPMSPTQKNVHWGGEKRKCPWLSDSEDEDEDNVDNSAW